MRATVTLDSATTPEIRAFLAAASPKRRNLHKYPRVNVEGPFKWGAETDPIDPLDALYVLAAAYHIDADETLESGHPPPIWLTLRPGSAELTRRALYSLCDEIAQVARNLNTRNENKHYAPVERSPALDEEDVIQLGQIASRMRDLLANLPSA